METAVLYKMIDEIDWSQYETAYGNAAQDIPHFQAGKTPSVPRSLWDLFSGDRERAIRATGDLWAGLCHQHAYISSAALPAYDFLMIALRELDDELKVELLDIFLGFAHREKRGDGLGKAAAGQADQPPAGVCRTCLLGKRGYCLFCGKDYGRNYR